MKSKHLYIQNGNLAEEREVSCIEPDTVWGWNSGLSKNFQLLQVEPGTIHSSIGRITGRFRHVYQIQVYTNLGWIEYKNISLSGALEKNFLQPDQYPAVGDWVLVEEQDLSRRIYAVIPRVSQLGRKVAGKQTMFQVLAANITHVLIVLALDGGRNFNLRFLERALISAWNSGAQPVVILNKVDCSTEEGVQQALEDSQFAAPGCPVFPLSAHRGDGIEPLLTYVHPGDTLCMLGKSGVGKSALVNRLAGYEQVNTPILPLAKEGLVRDSDREGRHTTTDSRLYRLESGVLIIDGPGIRELQIWADQEDLDQVFQEISELSSECRFSDCSHQGEPGCAVQQALVEGILDPNRYESYLELQREQAYVERRQNLRAMRDEKLKWKQISKTMKHYKKPGR